MAFAKLDEMKGQGPSKARYQKPLAFPIYVPDGGHQMQPPCFRFLLCSALAHVLFTRSFCSFSWPNPTTAFTVSFFFLSHTGNKWASKLRSKQDILRVSGNEKIINKCSIIAKIWRIKSVLNCYSFGGGRIGKERNKTSKGSVEYQ